MAKKTTKTSKTTTSKGKLPTVTKSKIEKFSKGGEVKKKKK
jgi:hypothetical protein